MLAARGLRLADLNPDRMWPVYRRYHLLIVSQRDDERNGALTTAVVEVLSRERSRSKLASRLAKRYPMKVRKLGTSYASYRPSRRLG